LAIIGQSAKPASSFRSPLFVAMLQLFAAPPVSPLTKCFKPLCWKNSLALHHPFLTSFKASGARLRVFGEYVFGWVKPFFAPDALRLSLPCCPRLRLWDQVRPFFSFKAFNKKP
jgi:hypothetical protein